MVNNVRKNLLIFILCLFVIGGLFSVYALNNNAQITPIFDEGGRLVQVNYTTTGPNSDPQAHVQVNTHWVTADLNIINLDSNRLLYSEHNFSVPWLANNSVYPCPNFVLQNSNHTLKTPINLAPGHYKLEMPFTYAELRTDDVDHIVHNFLSNVTVWFNVGATPQLTLNNIGNNILYSNSTINGSLTYNGLPMVNEIINLSVKQNNNLVLNTTVNTDSRGNYNYIFDNNVTGEYSVTVNYNDTHEDTVKYNVTKIPTILNLDKINDVIIGNSGHINGRLTTSDGKPLSNQGLIMLLDGQLTTGVLTNQDGVFNYTTASLIKPGVHTVSLSFNGNNEYIASNANGKFNVVVKSDSKIDLNPINNSHIGDKFDIKGKLTNVNNSSLSNQVVNIKIVGNKNDHFTVNTDNDGNFVAPYEATHGGVFNLDVSYAGDDTNNGCNNNGKFNVFTPIDPVDPDNNDTNDTNVTPVNPPVDPLNPGNSDEEWLNNGDSSNWLYDNSINMDKTGTFLPVILIVLLTMFGLYFVSKRRK
jgi:hypothetical protein